MRVLKTIKSEHIIAIDIETVRVANTFDDLDEGTQGAWEYKNKQDGEIPDFKELSDLWIRTSSLYAEFSKVCAVSIAFLHEDNLYCREFYGTDEKVILEELAKSLNKMSTKGKKEGIIYRLAGHASKYFDYPFLSKRYLINGMDIPELLDSTGLKPWEQNNLCTNELWKAGGTGAGSSLQALCNVFAVPVSKVDLVGDQVGTVYYEGGLDRIGKYCSYDTVATFNIIRKWKKESIFQFDDVVYVPMEEGSKEEKVGLLEQIANSKEILPEQVDLLLEQAKPMSEDEREKFIDILSACLLDTDKKELDVDEQLLIDKIRGI